MKTLEEGLSPRLKRPARWFSGTLRDFASWLLGAFVVRMTKSEIAAVLTDIGTLLELKGENPFKSEPKKAGA